MDNKYLQFTRSISTDFQLKLESAGITAEQTINDWLAKHRSLVALSPVMARVEAPATLNQWGWLPVISLINASGLLLVALGNRVALHATAGAEAMFWLGLLIVLLPVTVRLSLTEVSRRERIALVIWLGMSLYLVKILHSPYAFTYSDEFIHYYNTLRLLQENTLFIPNPILQVSALYPGLSLVTAALTQVGDLPIFYAGLTIIGAARLILYLAVYLFAEEVSRSPRVAGLAVVLYMCHSNFLFWSAQFSYESLSLPMAIAVLFLATRRERVEKGAYRMGLTVLACLLIVAIAAIHHLTSYFVAFFLLIWWLVARFRLNLLIVFIFNIVINPRVEQWFESKILPVQREDEAQLEEATRNPTPRIIGQTVGGLAIFALLAALAWLTLVASRTVNYLSPVLIKAIVSVVDLIVGEQSGRQLFVSSAGDVAPLWERLFGLGSVVLCLLGLPFGVWAVWRRLRYNPLALLLAGAAVGYFAMLSFRLTSAAWETGNRAAAYLFLGLAIVLALGIVTFWSSGRRPWVGASVIATYVAVIFMGGIIAGWPPYLRLTQPYMVEHEQQLFRPQGIAAAEWMRTSFGPGHRLAVDETNGRYMLAYGEQISLAGRYPNIRELLLLPHLPQWQIEVIQREQLRYIVMDDRRISWDNMAGYFFDQIPGNTGPGTRAAASRQFFDQEVYEKYDQQTEVDRIWDSGNLVIYDIEALTYRNASIDFADSGRDDIER